MPLLKTEAEKLSNNDLVAGVIEEIIDKEDLFAVLPFTRTEGKAYVFNREDETIDGDSTPAGVPEADFLDPNDTVVEKGAKFTQVTKTLKIIAGDVDVDKFLAATMSDTSGQKAIQIAQKAKGIARMYRRTLAIGDETANPKEFDGVFNLVSAGQTIQAGVNGGALTLTMLDELADQVPHGADAIMMRSGTIRALRSLLRASGGLEPAHVMLENFGRPVLTHNGIPVIVNDFLPINETLGSGTDLTSIYGLRLNEMDGLHGLYGGDNAGIVVEDIGTVQNKDATRTRLKWYASLVLKADKSLARLEGVTDI